MSVVVGYSNHKTELKYLSQEIRASAAVYSDENWEVNLFGSIVDFANFVKDATEMDLVCISINNDVEVSLAELIRKSNENSIIMIITDTDVSPMKYMKPTIMAASLLLRPFSKEQAAKTISDLFSFIEKKSGDKENNSFVIKSKSERHFVEYDKIVYFEARDKKLFLNTARREYGFYDTMDQLQEQLPESFIRCHRGYMINSKKIKKIALSEGVIYMEGDIIIPLSKSYKPQLKELKANARN